MSGLIETVVTQLFGNKTYDALVDVWTDEARSWTFGRLGAGDSDLRPIADDVIRPGERYLVVTLETIHIPNSRKGWSTFYPALHAFASVPGSWSPEPTKYHVFTTPDQLKALSPGAMGNLIVGEQVLVGPLPFWGSPLRLELGLFAIKAEDLTKPFLALLSDLSSAAGGTFAAATALAGPLRDGAALLAGIAGDSLEIGYFGDLREPATGHYAVVAQDDLDTGTMAVRDGRLRTAAGEAVDAPYFIFAIEGLSSIAGQHHRVAGLPEAWRRLTTVVTDEAPTAAKLDAAWQRVQLTIAASPDLIPTDKDIVTKGLEPEYLRIRQILAAPVGGGPLGLDALAAEEADAPPRALDEIFAA